MIFAGCSTPDAARSQGRVDWVQLSGFWQPHLLYLLDSPYPRLYVEVDAVEGCAPEDATLNKLRDFLATHCRKPEGIEIARSDVIPIKDARGVPSKALARKFMNGPPEKTGHSSPAFNDAHHRADDLARREELAAVVSLLAHFQQQALIDLRKGEDVRWVNRLVA